MPVAFQVRSPFARAKPKAEPTPVDGPGQHLRTAPTTMRTAQLAHARDVLTVLPEKGEALHAIMVGRFDVTDLLSAVFERLGPVDQLCVATLSFAHRNLAAMQTWIETGTVKC